MAVQNMVQHAHKSSRLGAVLIFLISHCNNMIQAQAPTPTKLNTLAITQWSCSSMLCGGSSYVTWVYGTAQPTCSNLYSPSRSITSNTMDYWHAHCSGGTYDFQFATPVVPNGMSVYANGNSFDYLNIHPYDFAGSNTSGGSYTVTSSSMISFINPSTNSQAQVTTPFAQWNTLAATNWKLAYSDNGVYIQNQYLITYICPAGYYATSATTCTRCPANMYNDGSLSAWCYSCPAYTTSPAGSTTSALCAPIPCSIGTYSASGYQPCNNCPFLTYTTSTQSTGCLPCTVCTGGRYYSVACSSPNPGVCQVCMAGYYCLGSINPPTPCSAGAYCPTTSLSASTPCPFGAYCPTTGLLIPTPCAPGFNCPNASMTTQAPCAASTYSANASQTACTSCAAGTSSPPGASVCSSCAAGSYSTSTTSTVCTLCVPGTFLNSSGATSSAACTTCSNLTYSTGSGATSPCASCGPGKYVISITQPCAGCAIGRYCNLGVSIPCAPGLFSNVTNSSACTTCPAGTYSLSTSSTACLACAAGTVCPAGSSAPGTCASLPSQYAYYSGISITTGSDCPFLCIAGYQLPLCSACPADFFCPNSTTVPCPAGTTTLGATGAGSYVDCVCAPGTFGSTTGPATASCAACPQNSFCDASVPSCTCSTAGRR